MGNQEKSPTKKMIMDGKLLGYEKKTVAMVVVAVVLAGIFFYAGAKYEKHKLGALGLLDCKKEQVAKGALSLKGILTAKDEKSFTIKLADGTEKTLPLSTSTTFGSHKNGVSQDFLIGQLLVVTGNTNPDGSLVIDNIKVSKKSPKITPPPAPTSTPTTSAPAAK